MIAFLMNPGTYPTSTASRFPWTGASKPSEPRVGPAQKRTRMALHIPCSAAWPRPLPMRFRVQDAVVVIWVVNGPTEVLPSVVLG